VNVSEGFRQSFETISHNKLRTFLTMLGMNIGVGSVIAVMAIGLMSRGAVMRGIESIGSSLLWVRPNRAAYPDRVEPMQMRPADLEALADLAGTDAWITPLLRANYPVGRLGWQQASSVFGVWPGYAVIWSRESAAGRFLTAEDVDRRQRVVVLGRNTARALFDSESAALGGTVTIGGRDFLVVGVMAAKERSPVDDSSDDDTCYVPFEILSGMTDWTSTGGPRVPAIHFKVKDLSDLDGLASRVERYLASAHGEVGGEPRFVVRSAEESIQTTNKVFDIVTTVITLIAGISLVVGGIGIMNIMLVTVTERTREIGIRKALGARRRDILGQFLIESVIICLIGGGLGIVLGILVTAVVSIVRGWEYLLPWFAVAVGLVVSISIGLFFGIYPAVKAARLDPVVALTKE
jgi:putative ABC transport system permease protein